MRKEATLEQWGELYEIATRIKEKKPWEEFGDMDLIGIKNGAEEDTVFFSILGRSGECYGITVYKGYEGLNRLLMVAMQESLGLSVEYVLANQRCLTCYWGSRDELTNKQRKIIKELGYTYRGKNQWLYFLSFEPGYEPYNMDEAEVARMSEYLRDFEFALQCYAKTNEGVDFEHGNMFLLTFRKDKETWSFGEEPLPFTEFRFGSLAIVDEDLISDLEKTPKTDMILEADIWPMGVSVKDKKYSRPASPSMILLVDALSGMVINMEMLEPDREPLMTLADILLDLIFQHGAPKEIQVTNILLAAGLEDICQACGTQLRVVEQMKDLDVFKQGLAGRFG